MMGRLHLEGAWIRTFVWRSLGGGALIAAALTLARLLLENGLRGGERRLEHEERRRHQQRDAEARLERLLHDRLADADRRLERVELDCRPSACASARSSTSTPACSRPRPAQRAVRQLCWPSTARDSRAQRPSPQPARNSA